MIDRNPSSIIKLRKRRRCQKTGLRSCHDNGVTVVMVSFFRCFAGNPVKVINGCAGTKKFTLFSKDYGVIFGAYAANIHLFGKAYAKTAMLPYCIVNNSAVPAQHGTVGIRKIAGK